MIAPCPLYDLCLGGGSLPGGTIPREQGTSQLRRSGRTFARDWAGDGLSQLPEEFGADLGHAHVKLAPKLSLAEPQTARQGLLVLGG